MIIYLIIVCALVGLAILMIMPAIRLLESRPILLLWVLVLIFVALSLFGIVQLFVINFGEISINVIAPILLFLTFRFFCVLARWFSTEKCGTYYLMAAADRSDLEKDATWPSSSHFIAIRLWTTNISINHIWLVEGSDATVSEGLSLFRFAD